MKLTLVHAFKWWLFKDEAAASRQIPAWEWGPPITPPGVKI